jgi:RND family efflux transporter MFP subunit
LRNHGLSLQDVGEVPIDVGLQTEKGYPHVGKLDYVAPEITSTTGTLAGRAVFDNKDRVLLPGLFVRVRIPKQLNVETLLVPDEALGNNQLGRYLLVVNDKNVVEQRQVEVGEQIDGSLRIVKNGLKPDERIVVGGLMRALPGSTVVPVPTAATAKKAGQ